MNIIQALILGIIQGVSEFLPISSTGHLILVPYLFHWNQPSLFFDVILHLGTLMALLVVFWKDWVRMIRAFFSDIKSKNRSFANFKFETRLLLLIIIGSIPAFVFGFLMKDLIEKYSYKPEIVAGSLILVALIMIWVERKAKVLHPLKTFKPLQGLMLGLAQSLALVPGVSRSGITIVAGMLAGLQREEAARFSFLLATPAVAGAGLDALLGLLKNGENSLVVAPLLIGLIASAVVGFLSIKFLLFFLKQKPLYVFAFYRIALAILIISLLLIR